MHSRLLFLCALELFGAGLSPALAGSGKAEHVVVLVWDGLRPDFITPQYTPTLYELAKSGTFFMRNHSAYVTTTEVNGAALATGMQPDHSGIIANTEYRPEFSWLTSYATEALDVVRRGDLASQGHYLLAPTVAELLHGAGFPTMIAGAKPIALLHDRAPRKTSEAEKNSVTLFRGLTLPRSALDPLIKARDIGPFPGTEASEDGESMSSSGGRGRRNNPAPPFAPTNTPPLFPGLTNAPRLASASSVDAWTTKALVRGLWKNGIPKFSLLWLSEPDSAQHASGPGSEAALSALQSSDDQLALVLKTLEEKNATGKTDIFVISDHGFSTISRGPDIVELLKKMKFTAGRQFQNPESGDILVNILGGTTFFYVFEHDQQVIRRLVAFLQGTDFAGVIFSEPALEGTFPLSEVHLAAKDGMPDVVVSMRWTPEENEHGTPGLLAVADGVKGRGSHGSLSPFDLHNALVAAGPDIKPGFVSNLPTGNVDLAPTVLAIFGITPSSSMDGRVLYEAFVDPPQAPPKPVEKTIEASRDLGFLSWTQYIKMTQVGSTVYYDEGNGRIALKPATSAN